MNADTDVDSLHEYLSASKHLADERTAVLSVQAKKGMIQKSSKAKKIQFFPDAHIYANMTTTGAALPPWPLPGYDVTGMPCQNGGYKLYDPNVLGGLYRCVCAPNYFGPDCRYIQCLNGGVPASQGVYQYCHCPPGFNGFHCEPSG